MKTRIINLTPHAVTICDAANVAVRTFPSEGTIRLKAVTVDAGNIIGCKSFGI
jgi:hypothetical protein